jgi:hypothetical protein
MASFNLSIATGSGQANSLIVAINPPASPGPPIYCWKSFGALFNDGGLLNWRYDGTQYVMELRQQNGDLRAWLNGWVMQATSSGEPPMPWVSPQGVSGGIGGTMLRPGNPGLLGPAINWSL